MFIATKAILVAALWFLILCVVSTPARGDDWPQFLGPHGNGTSAEKNLSRSWPEGGPKILWRVPIGQGWSCPSVSGDDLFLIAMGAKNGKATLETVRCLDAATGNEKWIFSYPNGSYYTGWWQGGPRSTPTITDKNVYTIGLMGQVYCLDRKTGKPVWNVSLLKDVFPGALKGDTKGFNMSPIICDGVIPLLLHSPDNRTKGVGEDDVVIAGLDAVTGQVKWTYKEPIRELTPSIGPDNTPTAVTFGGEKCFLYNANRMLKALRASDGKEIWHFEHQPDNVRGSSIASLMITGDMVLDVASDFGKPVMTQVDFFTPPFQAKKMWSLSNADYPHLCTTQNLVPLGDYAYGFCGKYDPNGTHNADMSLLCVELKTGKVMWKQNGFKMGVSLIEADGLLFARSHQTLTLVEATPAGYHQLGRIEKLHNLENRNFTPGLGDWVMPVLSGGRLYIRLPTELLCLDVAKP